MTTVRLQGSMQAQVQNDGTATTLPFGPVRQLETWVIERYSINSAHACLCTVYIGSVSPTNQLDFTRQGRGDTSTDGNITLKPGDKIIVQWVNATVGDICTFAYNGRDIVEGDAGYGGM